MEILAVNYPARQRGVVLVVALIMLLVMTGIGITVMSGSTLQERMAGNNRQMAVARLNAEAALRQAEANLAEENFAVEREVVDDFCQNSSDGKYIYARSLYRSNGGRCGQSYPAIFSMDLSRRSSWSRLGIGDQDYVIEYIGRVNYGYRLDTAVDISVGSEYLSDDPLAFRITAIGYGENENIYAVLQSIYTTVSGAE